MKKRFTYKDLEDSSSYYYPIFEAIFYANWKYYIGNELVSGKLVVDDFYPIPLRRVLDYSTSKQLASKYKSVSELLSNDKSLYGTLLKKGWMKDFFPKI